MTITHKICLALLILLLLIAVLSYLPARGTVHWILRVVVPELGLGLLLIGLLPALALGKACPKTAAGVFGLLTALILVPWFQAIGVASSLPKEMSKVFLGGPDRHPLQLGATGSHTKRTESYQDGKEWDRYSPDGQPKARLLFVHGGSWRNGTRGEYPQLFEYLAGRGYEVMSVTYTLSGEAPYPAAPTDVEKAIVKAYDPDIPLFVGGRSSGGHLALLCSYRKKDLVSGVIGFYPPVDMKWSYENPSNPHVLNSQEAILQFFEATPEEKPELYTEASPIDVVTEDGPPTLLIHGRPDCMVFHRQSEMLSERLGELGVSHYLLSLPWAEHGGDVQIYGPTGRLSLWAIESFLESSKPIGLKTVD